MPSSITVHAVRRLAATASILASGLTGAHAQSEPVVLHGEIASVQTLRSGEREQREHGLIRIRLEDGRTVVVDLGSGRRLQQLGLDQGDRVRITGTRTTIDGREVIQARRLQLDGERVLVADERPEPQAEVAAAGSGPGGARPEPETSPNQRQAEPEDREAWWEALGDDRQSTPRDRSQQDPAARAEAGQAEPRRFRQAELEDREAWWEALEDDEQSDGRDRSQQDPAVRAEAGQAEPRRFRQAELEGREAWWEALETDGQGGDARQQQAQAQQPQQAGDEQAAQLMLQGRVEAVRDLRFEGRDGPTRVLRIRLRDGSSEILDLSPWSTQALPTVERGDHIVVRGERRPIGDGRSIVMVDGLVVIDQPEGFSRR